MPSEIRVAMIGLDTSHSIEFAKRIQAPDCPADQKVAGMRVTSCLRFETPFQNKDGLDARQKQLESWNIPVTESFDSAVKDCDAVLLEINDASYHKEYFERVAALGKPVFIDKPLADTFTNGKAMYDLAKKKALRCFTASSLRFSKDLDAAKAAVKDPLLAYAYGPLGKAPAGSSIVWYGVHTFERLNHALGRGAKSVTVSKDALGVVAAVEYDGPRRGIAELTEGLWAYGGTLRTKEKSASYTVDPTYTYRDLVAAIGSFFAGKEAPVSMEDGLEIMAMLDAAERSFQSEKKEAISL